MRMRHRVELVDYRCVVDGASTAIVVGSGTAVGQSGGLLLRAARDKKLHMMAWMAGRWQMQERDTNDGILQWTCRELSFPGSTLLPVKTSCKFASEHLQSSSGSGDKEN